MADQLWYIRAEDTEPYANQALEEHLFYRAEQGQPIFYLWQNRRTVVLGRNQNCWKECRVELLRSEGGYPARRISGGGAVFHDIGNLNFTFCAKQADYDVARQLSVMIKTLEELGISAEKSGRNDVLAQGRKFSGNAFYTRGDRCCHHGTLMVDVDRELLARYLRPSPAKLAAKGVDSVRSRVINLRQLKAELTVDMLAEALLFSLQKVYGCPLLPLELTDEDRTDIAARREHFADPDWIMGRGAPCDICMEQRFPWGELQLEMTVVSGKIGELHISSDAMDTEFVPLLEQALIGCDYRSGTMAEAVRKTGEKYPAFRQFAKDTALWLKGEEINISEAENGKI